MTLNRPMNVIFKQAQLLPALTPAMLAGERTPRSFCPTGLTRPTSPTKARLATPAAAPPAPAGQLPRLGAELSTGERVLFAVLTLSAVICVGQALAPTLQWAPNLPRFTAWVGRLSG